MIPERSHRYQKAVYWPLTGRDRYAAATVDPANPLELDVRWVDVLQEVRDPQGNTITIEAEVEVDRDIPIGSKLWKGALDDLPGTAFLPETDVMQVYSFNATPDLRNRQTYRVLKLMRSKDTL